MIIGDFDGMGSVRHPDKTDPPLIIDPDAVLSDPIPFQFLQPISCRRQQIFKIRCAIEHRQLPFRHLPKAGELLDVLSGKDQLRLLVSKASDYDCQGTSIL